MYILGSLVVPPRRILIPNSPVGVQPVSSALIFLRGSSRNTVIAWSYHSDKKEKLIPNSPVGVQPVSSALIFLLGSSRNTVIAWSYHSDKKEKLIPNSPVGVQPVSSALIFSPGEQQKHCPCRVVPQRQKGKINSQLTGWSPTGEFGINFLSGGAAETLSLPGRTTATKRKN